MNQIDRRRQVEELFQEVAELPLPEREARLASAAVDPSLRAEVEMLLRLAASDLGRFLDSPLVVERKRPAFEAREIGRYVLRDLIGEGAFGSVYLAEQRQPIRRKVAVKVLKRDLDLKQVVARFEAERQALALMDHPSIARVFEAGETDDGLPYFAMELVAGQPITEYCDAHCLPVNERLALFLAVTEAVQHAHQKGIIHRDLKPSNILVTSLEGAARPKVIDFGIAKATSGQRLTDKTLATQLHTLVGTPAYMSPEQADLNTSDVDTRADIYSLGVLLYELLTGQTPLDSETLKKSGIDEVRRLIRETEPGRPSSRLERLFPEEVRKAADRRRSDPPRLAAAVRGDLDWIVLKALEKDRTRRYATASDLAADLERHLRHEAVLARPPSRLYLLRKAVRRHRAAFGVAAVIVLLLAAGLALTSWQMLVQRELRLEAEAARNVARIQAYSADMKAASIALGESNLGQAASLLARYLPREGEPDVRGFEWRYLQRLARGDELRSFEHEGVVTSACLSSDGKWVAASSRLGDVKIWDVDTGKVLRTFPGLRNNAIRSALALSPDGRRLAYARDEVVVILDTADWNVVRELPGRTSALAFSLDGRRFARMERDGIHLHETASWEESANLTRNEFRPAHGCMALDGQRLLAVLGGKVVSVWDLDENRCIQDSLGPPDANAVAISPDGKFAAIGTTGGYLYLWDLKNLREISNAAAHGSWLMSVAFSADGRLLASGGGDQRIKLWDVSGESPALQEPVGVLRGHFNELWSVVFSPDGRRLVSGSKDATAKIWSIESPPARHLELRPRSGAWACGFSAEGGLFRVAASTGEIQFYRTSDGQLIKTFPLPEPLIGWPLWKGDRFFLSGSGGEVATWELPRGEKVRSIRLDAEAVEPLAVGRDDRLLVGWDRAAKVARVWDFTTGRSLSRLPGFYFNSDTSPAWVRASISPDGRWLAYAASDIRVILWDLAKQAVQGELRAHAMGVFSLSFSPDGTRLATAGGDGAVIVWDWAAARPAVPPLRGHFAGVLFVSFSSDGRTLVAHSGEGTLRFWNAATGTETLLLQDADSFWSCPISPDGRTLAWRHTSTGGFRMMRLE